MTDSNQWMIVAQDTSIENKKIDTWQAGSVFINSVRLNRTKSVDTPVIKVFVSLKRIYSS